MKAKAQSLRITPKKLNLIADLIRNKDAMEAMKILNIAPKKGANILHKVVGSAIANAKNNFKQDENSLYIKEILVGKAATFKRWLPASRGRMQPILKRNAHVTITLGVKEKAVKATPVKEEKPKKVTKKTTAPIAKKTTSKPKKTAISKETNAS
ncbi:50S ribosomal protein L22 [Patescibacteria group bacterium]|nr:50S ribosomal protein L22 [Patescibacteria group bacterium]MBU1703510.1 50S ribosomal protein L22 [Patescibacteria group bacterium]MBU1953417.1 50S ribosomal protein L22 [Patescibacteria group bacterium]